MKLSFLSLFVYASCACGAQLFVPYVEEQALAWDEHKHSFSNALPSKTNLLESTVAEDAERFMHFLDSLKLADLRNAAEEAADGPSGSSIHGATKFSSMSQGEYEHLLLNDALRDPPSYLAKVVDSPVAPVSGLLSRDWTGNLTSLVRNQGSCAAGWAFSAAAQLESDAKRLLGTRHVLSPQQILACDDLHGDYCDGGWPESAFAYTRRAGGLQTEKTYPFESIAGAEPSCTARADHFVVTAADTTDQQSVYKKAASYAISRESARITELAMAYHVAYVGPLVVCIDATKLSTYTGGVMSQCGIEVNHCVQVVGIHRPEEGQQEGWWRLKNSFGTNWGEGGYFRLRFGHNTCGITTRPTFTSPSYSESLLRQAADNTDFPYQTSEKLIRKYRQIL